MIKSMWFLRSFNICYYFILAHSSHNRSIVVYIKMSKARFQRRHSQRQSGSRVIFLAREDPPPGGDLFLDYAMEAGVLALCNTFPRCAIAILPTGKKPRELLEKRTRYSAQQNWPDVSPDNGTTAFWHVGRCEQFQWKNNSIDISVLYASDNFVPVPKYY